MNLANYIWGYKPVIGSNDYYNAVTSEKVLLDDKNRAYFQVTYDKQPYNVDSETALSIILQYLYYTCLKNETVNYSTFPQALPSLLNEPHNMVIAVSGSISA